MSSEFKVRRDHKMNTISGVQKSRLFLSTSLFNNTNNNKNIKQKVISKEVKKINEISESSIISENTNKSQKTASIQKNISVDIISSESSYGIQKKNTVAIPNINKNNFLRNTTHIKTNINPNNASISKMPSNEIMLERANSRNAINFMDRTRIKATNVVNLKLFEKFEEDTRQKNKSMKREKKNNEFKL